MMKASELAAKCVDVAKNYKTRYLWGGFGAPVTGSLISRLAGMYPLWYTPVRQAAFRALIKKGYYAFDCVGLIKGILWGWCGDISRVYGGAGYNANGVPDVTANGMFAKCTDRSTDFSRVEVGEALWMDGHIGIYIGNGLGVEATPKWDDKVQITAVGNIGARKGYNTRTWTKHGKLPYVTYGEGDAPAAEPAPAPLPGKIAVGSKVKLRNGAKTYTGGNLAVFVYSRTYAVSQLNGDRAVITFNGVIVAAVNVADLTLA